MKVKELKEITNKLNPYSYTTINTLRDDLQIKEYNNGKIILEQLTFATQPATIELKKLLRNYINEDEEIIMSYNKKDYKIARIALFNNQTHSPLLIEFEEC